MKRLSLIFSLFLIACAQPSNQISQEEVVQEEVQKQVIVPFDPSTATHVALSDPRAFFGHPRDLLPRIDEKDEFETTQQFEERIEKQRTLTLDWDASKSYLIESRNSHRFEYNADDEVFKQLGSIPCHDKWPGDYWNCLVIPFVAEPTSSQPFFHRYGEWLDLLIPNSRADEFERTISWIRIFPNTCPIPLEEARDVAPFLRIAYVYKFDEPVIHRGYREETRSVDGDRLYLYEHLGIHGDITHIVCYHDETGEILHQREI